jgi:hypothetical protein
MSMPSPRPVSALRGAQWLVNAYALFRRSPVIWVAMVLALLLAMLVSGAIPLIGPLVFGLLFPILSAGIARAAMAGDHGEPIEGAHFLAGFRASTGDLVAIGGLYMVGQLLVVGVMFAIGGSALQEGIAAAGRSDPPAAAAIGGRAVIAGLVGMALLVPLLMATWFAPLLVFFHQQKALPALLASLGACLKNWSAFLVYFVSIVLIMLAAKLVLMVLAFIPLIGPLIGLALVGAMVAVLAPVGFIAFYTSYIDVFSDAIEVDPAASPDRIPLP